jgi:hypothetical protein
MPHNFVMVRSLDGIDLYLKDPVEAQDLKVSELQWVLNRTGQMSCGTK